MTTRTRRPDELTLPEYLRVRTMGEIVASACDEMARQAVQTVNEQPAGVFAQDLADILTKAATDTRTYLNAKRLATNGHVDPRINTSHIGGE